MQRCVLLGVKPGKQGINRCTVATYSTSAISRMAPLTIASTLVATLKGKLQLFSSPRYGTVHCSELLYTEIRVRTMDDEPAYKILF